MRFVECVNTAKHVSDVTLEIHPGPERRGTWGHKNEEYMADFILLARRHLSEEEYRIFRFRFLLGGDWRLAERRLGLDRGTFFNHVYSIMYKLGRIFAELEPYPLFPLSGYFHGSVRTRRSSAYLPGPDNVTPIRPPVPGYEYDDQDGELRAA